MSFRSFLEVDEINSGFKTNFGLPNISTSNELIVEPQSRRYGQVMLGFKYLLKFYLEAEYNLPRKYWMAEWICCQLHQENGEPPFDIFKVAAVQHKYAKLYF